MQMQYWKNEKSEVYGFDTSDDSQIEAMNERLAIGSWENITSNWPPEPIPPTSDENKNKAIRLLTETDWINQPDVIDIKNDPHLLNQNDFLVYRIVLRRIAINAQAGHLVWPNKPEEQWS